MQLFPLLCLNYSLTLFPVKVVRYHDAHILMLQRVVSDRFPYKYSCLLDVSVEVLRYYDIP